MEILPIIGLPPGSTNEYGENDLIKDTMPIAEITPMKADFALGLSTLSLKSDIETYKKILSKHAFYLTGNTLKLAFLADSFPTDNFQNTYQEGFLQDKLKTISKTAQTVMQTLGASTMSEAVNNGAKAFDDLTQASDGQIPLMGTANSFLQGAIKKANSFKMGNLHSEAGKSLASTIDAIGGGARVDFPQIWNDSSFNPSYTMTVRLYNPFPSDPDSTEKYIIGPIAAIMILGIPRSSDKSGSTYNFPFLIDIKCRGIYYLNPCYISNISIIKGGDQQQIAYNQRLGIVDVRIDFGSLFSSMLVSEEGEINNNRPNLRNYLDAMRDEKKLIKSSTTGNGWSDKEDTGGDVGVVVGDIIDIGGGDDSENKEIEYNIIKDNVKKYGGLKKTIDNDFAIPMSIAEKLYDDNIITFDDLKNTYPETTKTSNTNINTEDIKEEMTDAQLDVTKSIMLSLESSDEKIVERISLIKNIYDEKSKLQKFLDDRNNGIQAEYSMTVNGVTINLQDYSNEQFDIVMNSLNNTLISEEKKTIDLINDHQTTAENLKKIDNNMNLDNIELDSESFSKENIEDSFNKVRNYTDAVYDKILNSEKISSKKDLLGISDIKNFKEMEMKHDSFRNGLDDISLNASLITISLFRSL